MVRELGFGVPGQSDLIGHRSPDGKCFYVEVKTSTGTVKPEQKKFLAAMASSGALAGVARSPEQALAIVFPEEN